MCIFVRPAGEHTFIMETSRSTTIAQLKLAIDKRTRIPAAQQTLSYTLWELADSKDLAHYEVADNDTIWLSFRMLGGADHVENDSPSEHGNETPRPRTRSPSSSTTIDYRSPTARTATTPTRPAKPSRRRRRYQFDNTVLRASTPGIQLRLTPRYHHRDHKARFHPEWNDIVRG